MRVTQSDLHDCKITQHLHQDMSIGEWDKGNSVLSQMAHLNRESLTAAIRTSLVMEGKKKEEKGK